MRYMVRKIGKDKACREPMQVNRKPYCCLTFPLIRKNSCSAFAVSLELFPKKVLGTTMPNLHPVADEIRRRPEAEVLLVARDNRTEVMRKVLTCLMYDSSPLTGEDLGEGDTPPTALCTPFCR